MKVRRLARLRQPRPRFYWVTYWGRTVLVPSSARRSIHAWMRFGSR